jgi:hypothetical protein
VDFRADLALVLACLTFVVSVAPSLHKPWSREQRPYFRASLASDAPLWALLYVAAWLPTYVSQHAELAVTASVAGVVFFLLGLAAFRMAYWRRSLHWSIAQRPWIRLLPAPEEYLRCRHTDRIGLVAQTLGLVVLSGNLVLLALSIPIIALALWFSISRGELQEFDEWGRSTHDEEEGQYRYPRIGAVFEVVIAVFMLTALGGVLFREVSIFDGTWQTATSSLSTLAQVVATVAVLAITIAFVVAQVTASELSVRSSALLARHPEFIVPLTTCVVSVFWSIGFMSHGEFGNPNERSHSVGIDLALLFGILAGASVIRFVWKAPKLLAPELVTLWQLEGLNAAWASIVRRDWQEGRSRHLRVGDPLVSVERILTRALESRDQALFELTTLALGERIERYFVRDDLVALDAYLDNRLGALIQAAARDRNERALDALLKLWQTFGEESRAGKVDKLKSSLFLAPWENSGMPGERLCRNILSQAAEYTLTEVVRKAIASIDRNSSGIVNDMNTKALESRREIVHSYRKGDRSRSSYLELAGHDRVSGFEEYYGDYLAKIGRESFVRGSYDITYSCSYSLGRIMSNIMERVTEKRTRWSLIRRISWSMQSLVDEISKIHTHTHSFVPTIFFTLQSVENAVEKIPDHDSRLANDLSHMTAAVTRHLFNSDLLKPHDVRDVAHIAKRLGQRFPKAQETILDVLIELARAAKTRSGPDSPYDALVDAIRDQRNLWGPRASERIRAKVSDALADLQEKSYSRNVPW